MLTRKHTIRVSPNISIIIINVNDLNFSVKRILRLDKETVTKSSYMLPIQVIFTINNIKMLRIKIKRYTM